MGAAVGVGVGRVVGRTVGLAVGEGDGQGVGAVDAVALAWGVEGETPALGVALALGVQLALAPADAAGEDDAPGPHAPASRLLATMIAKARAGSKNELVTRSPGPFDRPQHARPVRARWTAIRHEAAARTARPIAARPIGPAQPGVLPEGSTATARTISRKMRVPAPTRNVHA